MTHPFRVLEHTADVGFEAFGGTRAEVFVNAARALVHLFVDLEAIEPCEEVEIRAEGANLKELLVNWLSEVLFLQDADHWLFKDFEIRGLSVCSLVAFARGEKFDPARHQIKLLIKAVTYHQLSLTNNAEGWRARVYVDI